MPNQSDSGRISLKGFESASHGTEFSSYISALESFDRIEQLQALKALGHERTGINPGAHVLDVGCGLGLETLRLARLVVPGGLVAGCDLSPDFLAEAVAAPMPLTSISHSSKREWRRCATQASRSASSGRSACSSMFPIWLKLPRR